MALSDRRDRLRRRSATFVLWACCAAASLACVVSLRELFTTGFEDWGDGAVNSLSVDRAMHFAQIRGNYSRVGFTHPGPALFYLLALGQGLFFSLTRIVPDQLNGQYLGLSLFTCLCVALSARAMYRLLGPLAVAASTTGVLFLFAAHHTLFANHWFPFLYGPPFFLMVVTGAALAAGRTEEAPWFVLAGGILAHGHVSFLLTVGVTTVLVAGSWYWHHRRGDASPITRLGLASVALLVVLLLLPVALQMISHFPSPLDEYYRYLAGEPPPAPPDDYTVWQFYRWYFGGAAQPVWVSLAGLVLAAGLVVTERDSRIRKAMLTCYGMLVLQAVLFFVFIATGVDAYIDLYRYVGLYFLVVPTLVVTFALAHLLARIHGATAERILRSRVVLVGTLALSAAALVAGSSSSELTVVPLPFQDVNAAIAAVRAARPGDELISVYVPTERWPDAAEVLLEARRAGMPDCVDPTSEVLDPFIGETCTGGARSWRISVVDPASAKLPESRVIWDDGRVAIIRGLPPARAASATR